MKQKKDDYPGIFNTLYTIENRIKTIKEQLRALKEGLSTRIPKDISTETTEATTEISLPPDSPQGER
jgi:hypothetical protein